MTPTSRVDAARAAWCTTTSSSRSFAPTRPRGENGWVAFVLGGGGGGLSAHEVGMLRAQLERGLVPDLVLGTSVGAINGAAVAADPSVRGVERLADV